MHQSARWTKSPVAFAAIALVLSAIAFDLLVLAWGETPASVAKQLLSGTWGTAYGIGQVLFKATSILIAAIAARVALRTGLFNIGIDGSVALGALAVGAVGAALPTNISHWVAWPLLTLIGMAVGALWALPAGILRARFGAHEVISGIMLNKIAVMLVGYLLSKGLAEHASVHTRSLPEGGVLTRLEFLPLPWFRALHGSAVNLAIFVVIGLVVAWPWLASRSIFGRELEAIGASPTASQATGIPVNRRLLQAMCISGALAGLIALNEVMGYKGYAEEGVAAGVGFTGIAAALLALDSTFALIAASLFFATLSQGGLSINARVPMEIVDVLVAIVILLVAVAPRVVAFLERFGDRALSPAPSSGSGLPATGDPHDVNKTDPRS
ncbi:MAG: ABC transporter permease [Polyangiales bacterium]